MSIKLFLISFLLNQAQGVNWVVEARRCSGESGIVREQAITSLKSIPDLEKILHHTLKTHSAHQALALDIIAILKLKSMWRILIDFSSRDPSGISYLTLIALTDETNHQEVSMMRTANSKP